MALDNVDTGGVPMKCPTCGSLLLTPVDGQHPLTSDYPVAFENLWAATWRHGVKGAAFKAWKRHGMPTAEQAKPAINAYTDAKRRSGQALQHVSVWLNAGGHLQTEWHLATINNRNAPPPSRPAPYHAPAPAIPGLREWATDLGKGKR